MKLIRDNNFTTIDFENMPKDYVDSFEKNLGQFTGVRQRGYEKTREYRMGLWDGYTRVYDDKNHRIADGLYPQLVTFIKLAQERSPLVSYSVEDNRDEPFMEVDDMFEKETFIKDGKELELTDYQTEAVTSAIYNTRGVIGLPVNGGKTAVSIGIINELQRFLDKGETVAYFVPSVSIFSQAISSFEENFGKNNVGYIGNQKRKLSKINVITLSSMASALKNPIDSKAVTVTGKKRVLQIFSTEIFPFFSERKNDRMILRSLIENYPATTKSRATILEWLKKAYAELLTDNKVRQFINTKNAEYVSSLDPNKNIKYQKYLKTLEFIKTVKVIIVDEGHHSGADVSYNTLLSFPNAQYKFAMTGSYDVNKQLQTQRMTGLFGNVIAEETNDNMIKRGISADPTINVVKIKGDIGLDETKGEDKDYLTVVKKGIVENDDRNNVITQLIKKMYEMDKPSLVIVGRLEHGENLSKILDELGVDNVFLNGSSSDEERLETLERYKRGDLKVIIGTTIFDEGLSVNEFKALFMVSSTRSPRLVIQRIGRVLRKKEGANTAIVFDFADETNIYLKSQADARMAIYKKEKFKIKYLN